MFLKKIKENHLSLVLSSFISPTFNLSSHWLTIFNLVLRTCNIYPLLFPVIVISNFHLAHTNCMIFRIYKYKLHIEHTNTLHTHLILSNFWTLITSNFQLIACFTSAKLLIGYQFSSPSYRLLLLIRTRLTYICTYMWKCTGVCMSVRYCLLNSLLYGAAQMIFEIDRNGNSRGLLSVDYLEF